MKLKCLVNLAVVCTKWHKNIWLVRSYYILKKNNEIIKVKGENEKNYKMKRYLK
jgi:hypothetical protein